MSSVESCHWCNVPIREVSVLVGESPAHAVTLRIDCEPHPDGRVIVRRDGRFRLLGDVFWRGDHIDGFRVHGAHADECAGSDA